MQFKKLVKFCILRNRLFENDVILVSMEFEEKLSSPSKPNLVEGISFRFAAFLY
jgi:hypothetical protein